jgi:hypothetical protein
MGTRRKSTDVREFARRLILSSEFQGTLRRRVLAAQIDRGFARTLLGYVRTDGAKSPETRWLGEEPALGTLRRIAGNDAEPRA